MHNLKIFCLDLYDEDYEKIKSLGYTPVGLGENNFNDKWIKDNTKNNISHKNKFYGEITFHYWLWKNHLKNIDDKTWVGFCAYRRLWAQKSNTVKINNKKEILHEIPKEWNNYDVILGNEIFMNGWTNMKLLKYGLKALLLKPKYFLKKNRNLEFHFDSFHGHGNLNKAIDLLDEDNKRGFKNFMLKKNSYNRGNMFLCRSKKIMNDYYNSLFPWLERCEQIFKFKESSYGETRLYGFLAERYLSYWFNKNTKPLIWPIIFFNINKNQL